MACSRSCAPRVGPVDELVADLLARSQEALCVGDGALRYRAEILDGFHCEIADDAHPSAGPLVQLAHARALREEWVSPAEIRPVYLRQPDAQINWATRASAAEAERDRERARPGSSSGRRRRADRSSRCATATSPRSWRSSGASYPKPWSAAGVPRRARPGRATATATTSSPAQGRAVVGYGGLMFVADEAHVTNIAVHPDHRRAGIATRLLGELADAAIDRGCVAWTLEVRASSTGAQALYRRVRLRARPASGPGTTRTTEDAIVMWCHDIQTRGVRPTPRGAAAPMTDEQVDGLTLVDDDVGPDTLVLGIETSCDETAAALVMGGSDVVSSVVSSQIDLHATFGGVVPEIASRAHLDLLNPVIARAIVEAGVDDRRIDAVACTIGPGLIGALLVGVSAAKALALAWDVPFVGVNHLEAHLYAALLDDPTIELPIVVLLVSGGHTMLVEMRAPGQLPPARPDDRRRRRRGVRQGRPVPRARLPGRPGRSSGSPSTATRRRSTSPGRCATTGSTSASPG